MAGDFVVGVDLAGPANHDATAVCWFRVEDCRLRYVGRLSGASDARILGQLQALAVNGRLIIGIDAPLSYNDGGGDRPGDAALRSALKAARATSAKVMYPTMPRMVYLTLRGVALSRVLTSALEPPPVIVEVHPGAAMALRGAPASSLQTYKRQDAASCTALARWLERNGLIGLPDLSREPDSVDACAGALAVWRWHRGESVWRRGAQPPFHPFDFAC